MVPKQVEMDGVVKNIYHALEYQRHLASSLLVLCGDHGMNDAGNHGGSSEGETSPALVFISPKLRSISRGVECPITVPNGSFEYYEEVKQSDIAPTLAALLGFPVPKNNLGVVIPSLMGFWNEGTFAIFHQPFADPLSANGVLFLGNKIRIMEQNAEQFHGVLQETFPSSPFDGSISSDACTDISEDGVRLACLWLCTQVPDHDDLLKSQKTKEAAFRTVCHLLSNGTKRLIGPSF